MSNHDWPPGDNTVKVKPEDVRAKKIQILEPLVKESQNKINNQELPPPAEFKVRSELGVDEARQVESTLPETPNFKVRSELEVGEAKQVEYRRDVLKIADSISKDSSFKGILAEFAMGEFDYRDQINNDNILNLINEFVSKYPTLNDFETKAKVDDFLTNISKPEKYSMAVADFEDMFYGEHKFRVVINQDK